MQLFIILIIAVSAAQTIMLMALINRACRYALAFIIAFILFISYPYSTMINMKDFTALLQNYDFLNIACAIVIAQSITALLTAFSFLQYRMEGKRQRLFHYLAFLPPPLLLAGGFLGMIYIFNRFGGLHFKSAALIFCIAFFISLCALPDFVSFFCGENEELKMEMAVLLYLFQIIISMVLPPLARWDGNLPEQVGMNFSSLAFIALAGGIVFIFYLAHRSSVIWKIKNK